MGDFSVSTGNFQSACFESRDGFLIRNQFQRLKTEMIYVIFRRKQKKNEMVGSYDEKEKNGRFADRFYIESDY